MRRSRLTRLHSGNQQTRHRRTLHRTPRSPRTRRPHLLHTALPLPVSDMPSLPAVRSAVTPQLQPGPRQVHIRRFRRRLRHRTPARAGPLSLRTTAVLPMCTRRWQWELLRSHATHTRRRTLPSHHQPHRLPASSSSARDSYSPIAPAYDSGFSRFNSAFSGSDYPSRYRTGVTYENDY